MAGENCSSNKPNSYNKALIIYVSGDGDDVWAGLLERPNAGRSDGPLATLHAARDAVRSLRRRGELSSQTAAEVRITPGVYHLDKSFVLADEDSGSPAAPIVYCAWGEGQTVLTGGKTVSQFESVRDTDVLARLSGPARRAVLVADLKAEGITDYGQIRSRGFGRPSSPAGLEVFFRGEPMTLARWPNDEYTTITHLPETSKIHKEHGLSIGSLEEGFIHESDRPTTWRADDDIWVHGFWAWDWANTYERVASINPQTHMVKTHPDYGIYGYRSGQRFYYLNVLEELDSPGEWYLDRKKGLLYFWPAGPIEQGQVEVSMLEEPLVSIDGASHVRLCGLMLSCTRGEAVRIAGGQGNTVENCRIRNIGTWAVVVDGGGDHSIRDCRIYNTGDGGIKLIGGDRKTLQPANHSARGNHLHNIARWSKCYCPAIEMHGVGQVAVGNLIHDHPHIAIMFFGNEHLIELNEIHSVCLETGDTGAIYAGRDYTYRGNVIRHNFIHHIGGVGIGSNGIYMDDNVSGTLMYGNVFWESPRAVFIGGGRDHRVENNIFVDCDPSIHVDGRGLDKTQVWRDMVYVTMTDRLEQMNWRQPPYSTRYPALADLEQYLESGDGVPPANNVFLRNISIGGKWMDVGWHAKPEMLKVGENLIDRKPHFVDASAGNFELKEDSPAWKMGFKRIPIEKIGLITGCKSPGKRNK